MRAFARAHPDWLTVVQLPACAPDLNPVEGAWSSMKAGLGNLSATSPGQLAAAIRSRPGRIQRQPALIAGLLGQARAHAGIPAAVAARLQATEAGKRREPEL